MNTILDKIDAVLEAKKVSFEEFVADKKNVKALQRAYDKEWKMLADYYGDEVRQEYYDEAPDDNVKAYKEFAMDWGFQAENEAVEKVLKKFKSKFNYSSGDDYTEDVLTAIGRKPKDF